MPDHDLQAVPALEALRTPEANDLVASRAIADCGPIGRMAGSSAAPPSAANHASSVAAAHRTERSSLQRAMLQLQRQHGNRYVGQVLSRAGVTGERVDLDEVANDIEQARGGGQSLDDGTRVQMESAFGADFAAVRVHTDSRADDLSQSLSARAFTTGRDVFFRQGEYSPGTSSGRELLAHELTHVVQQNGDDISRKMTVSEPDDPHEVEADQMARAVIQQEHTRSTDRQVISREEDEEKPLAAKRVADSLQRQPEAPAAQDEEEEEEKKLQTKLNSAVVSRGPKSAQRLGGGDGSIVSDSIPEQEAPSQSPFQRLNKTVKFADLGAASGPYGAMRSSTRVPLSGRPIQRAPSKKVFAPGWGGSNDGSFTFNPHADIATGAKTESRWFVASAVEEIEVSPDTRGTVVIYNPFYWNYHEISTTPGLLYGTNTTHTRSFGGPVEASVTATFSVDKDGKVLIGPPMKSGIVGFPSVLDGSLESVKQDGSDEGSVNISTILKSTKTVSSGGSTDSETSSGIDIKPEGVGVGGSSKSSTSQTWGVSTTGSGVWMGTYGVVFKVKRKPPTAVTAKISYDREGKFVSGDEGIDGVNAWWGRIPEPVRRQIKLGKKSVFIYGNATKTGSSSVNEAVVANRLKDVRKKLVALSERMDIVPENTGSVVGERSVVIEVRYTVDEATAVTP